MNTWGPVDFVILILAGSIAVALLISVIGPLFLGAPLSDMRSEIMSTVVSAIISVISVYVGAKIRPRNRDE